MREFRITFAQNDASGIYRPDIADALGERLAAAYGGFTRIDARGGYIMADGSLAAESVFVFDVATAADAESVYHFAAMAAAEIRRAMNQESVYFRNIDGRAHILAAERKPERKPPARKPEAAPVRAEFIAPIRANVARVNFTPPLTRARPETRTAADAGKPPETLAERAAKIRTIAESMAAADDRRGGGGYSAADILATAADSILADN